MSDRAAACPHCGAPRKAQPASVGTRWQAVVFIMLLGFLAYFLVWAFVWNDYG